MNLEGAQPQRASGSAPALSGELFGALINLAGRQRMLSQRIVLNAVLASLGQHGTMQIARETLTLFSDSHTTLVQGNRECPGVFFEDLRLAYFGPMQGDKHIRDFMDLAERTLDATATGFRSAPGLLSELGQSATSIVALLNRITVVYEDESRRYSQTQKKQLNVMMNDIKMIAKQARIVSCNAQIVAARAGNAGREFSVVAGVLSKITGEIDDLVHVALRINQ
ncbi:MAG: type IV pili methyl-accepting chemotaxis transducer N-terminal domain-containing protein [Burkholderiales bacterium]